MPKVKTPLTHDQIRQKGLDVLYRELGPVGMIRFLNQFETGSGDYARERHKWVDRMSLEDLRALAEKRKRIRGGKK
jgi:hypothetical protein